MQEQPSPRDRLEAIVACCRKRATRATAKAIAALDEDAAAQVALNAAEARLARWDEENPDPQGSIFEGMSDV